MIERSLTCHVHVVRVVRVVHVVHVHVVRVDERSRARAIDDVVVRERRRNGRSLVFHATSKVVVRTIDRKARILGIIGRSLRIASSRGVIRMITHFRVGAVAELRVATIETVRINRCWRSIGTHIHRNSRGVRHERACA